jgi:hypothetical protein
MKANTFEVVPGMIAAGRIRRLDESIATVAFARAVLPEDAATSAGPDLFLACRSAGHQAGDFWETLSYVVIWLCGLIGIGLCVF